MGLKIDINLKRVDGENERQYLWRVGKLIDSGAYENWKQVTPFINEQWRKDESEYRDESAYRKPVQYSKAYYEDVFAPMMQGDEYLKQLREQQWLAKQELIKIQTEKIELNK